MNLKELSKEHLFDLLKKVAKELYSREDKIIYDMPERMQNFVKVVTCLDPRKLDGYCLIGDFLSIYKQNKVPKNAIIVENDRNKYNSSINAIYRATGNFEKEFIAEVRNDWYETMNIISNELYGFDLKIEPNKELIDNE